MIRSQCDVGADTRTRYLYYLSRDMLLKLNVNCHFILLRRLIFWARDLRKLYSAETKEVMSLVKNACFNRDASTLTLESNYKNNGHGHVRIVIILSPDILTLNTFLLLQKQLCFIFMFMLLHVRMFSNIVYNCRTLSTLRKPLSALLRLDE